MILVKDGKTLFRTIVIGMETPRVNFCYRLERLVSILITVQTCGNLEPKNKVGVSR